jgi:hypothetical protein
MPRKRNLRTAKELLRHVMDQVLPTSESHQERSNDCFRRSNERIRGSENRKREAEAKTRQKRDR